jgi:hypothetical protein
MVHPVPRVVAAALCGALAGAVCLVLIYVSRSQVVTFESALQPPIGIGFYPAEHNGEFTFNWTSPVASISLPGLDRRSAWSCSVEFSGARPDPAMPQPDLGVAVDGVTVAVRRATNDIQTIDVVAPARPRKPGLDLTLTSSTTFVPGRSDPRTLGVRVDGLACRPVGSWIVLPPDRKSVV